MNNKLSKAVLFSATTLLFASCEKDDSVNTNDSVFDYREGAYVVNQGSWGMNNGTLQFIDFVNRSITSDIYYAQNNEMMGDLFQDVCVYGSKVYCSLTESSKILVLDREGKLIKNISMSNSEGQPLKPRYMKSYEGKLYISAYDEKVHKLDTTSLEIVSSVNVGSYPEAMTVANNKLFVNNSGWGSGNTVSVIDLNTFKNIKTIDVPLNPYTESITVDNQVYIVCCKGYGKDGENSTLVRINPSTYETSEIANASLISSRNKNIFIIYNDYYNPNSLSYRLYDVESGVVSSQDFIDKTTLSNPNSIDIDPLNGRIYISQINSETGLGEIYVYSSAFSLYENYSAGYYTSKVAFAY